MNGTVGDGIRGMQNDLPSLMKRYKRFIKILATQIFGDENGIHKEMQKSLQSAKLSFHDKLFYYRCEKAITFKRYCCIYGVKFNLRYQLFLCDELHDDINAN